MAPAIGSDDGPIFEKIGTVVTDLGVVSIRPLPGEPEPADGVELFVERPGPPAQFERLGRVVSAGGGWVTIAVDRAEVPAYPDHGAEVFTYRPRPT